MYFVFMCEKRTMSPVEIVLRRSERGWRKKDRGAESS
jgi:hypothetical protein